MVDTYVKRPCCPGGTCYFIEPADASESMAYAYRTAPAPVVAQVPEPEPDEHVAYHEAGHAVIGHALGAAIVSVSITAPAWVQFATGANMSPAEEIARQFGGIVGEQVRVRVFATLAPSEESEFLQRITDLNFGACDHCQMAMTAWRAAGVGADIEAARAVFRLGQRLALRLTERQDVRFAIRELAAQLMICPSMSGKRAASIIEPFIPFGSLKEEEQC